MHWKWVTISMEQESPCCSDLHLNSRFSTGLGITCTSSKATMRALLLVLASKCRLVNTAILIYFTGNFNILMQQVFCCSFAVENLDCGWMETCTKGELSGVARMGMNHLLHRKTLLWRQWSVGLSYRWTSETSCN